MNIQKKYLSLLLTMALLIPGLSSARTIVPPVKFGLCPERSRGMNSIEMGQEAPAFMFIATAGFLAGGKQNTCYLLKSRILIKKFALDGSAYFNFNGDKLYNANMAIGPNGIQFTAGVEFGDRSFYINKDSTLEHIKFKNVATGEYEPYSSFTDFRMPQDVVSYNIGVNIGGRFKGTNFWRGVGQCWNFVYLKWELMYAPTIGYSDKLDITTEGPYQATTESYELEGIKVRHFGFRMQFDSRLGSKIGWMMEVGMRPGIRWEINEENRFSNGYVRMGVVMAISVGGRKELDRPGFGREIPEN